MDMDTTIKGIAIDLNEIEKILNEIILIDLDDHVNFKIKNIKNIHDISEYDDFRVSMEAVSNTRARDFYDIYILMMLNKANFDKSELKKAIWKKAEERKSTIYTVFKMEFNSGN